MGVHGELAGEGKEGGGVRERVARLGGCHGGGPTVRLLLYAYGCLYMLLCMMCCEVDEGKKREKKKRRKREKEKKWKIF
jgi:hypothetical protein